jgi:hypothetical protein
VTARKLSIQLGNQLIARSGQRRYGGYQLDYFRGKQEAGRRPAP